MNPQGVLRDNETAARHASLPLYTVPILDFGHVDEAVRAYPVRCCRTHDLGASLESAQSIFPP